MAEGKYKEWLEPDKLILLQGWRRDGLRYDQIAHNIGISEKTLYEWQKNHTQIREALKKGEEVMVYEVENALYKSAVGYDVTETEQVETTNDMGEKVTTKRAKKRHIPPNVGAICFILKNRRSSKWQDKPMVVDTSALERLDAILQEAKKSAEAQGEEADDEVQQPSE